MVEISLEITAAGGIAMLHDDAVDLTEFGQIKVERASNVEYCDGRRFVKLYGVLAVGWYVQSAKTGEILAQGFKTRAEALAWEKAHYSPGGPGWIELKGGK